MLDAIKKYYDELKTYKKEIQNLTAKTVSKKELRDKAELLGGQWFNEYSELLNNKYELTDDLVKKYSQEFSKLIKISSPSNLKKSYLEILNNILTDFRTEIILYIQTKPKSFVEPSLLNKILEGLQSGIENEYLQEAINCAQQGYLRASIVLGWCATIDRIHRKIEAIGFSTFNVTSSQMASETKGRFKKFNSPQNISSLSESREVFDNVILWIIEGMQLIDSNQHTRLKSCFDLRCQCAHPGDAPITEYNLLSYFSDISEIVLKNKKFEITES